MKATIQIGQLIRETKAHSQTGPFGTQLKASEYVSNGVPVINVRNVGLGEIVDDSLEYISKEKSIELRSHLLEKNDIVFGRKGAIERHGIITDKQVGWLQGSDCIRLRFLTSEYNPRFISYFFRTKHHQQWMINLGSFGATMGSLNQDIINRIEIPAISLELQNQIANILSTYDELIDNNNQRISLLEQMAKEIYKEWFVRFRFPGHERTRIVDGVPEGWRKVSLGEIIKIKKGKNITKDTVNAGPVPVVAGGIKPSCYHDEANAEGPVVTISSSGANSGYVKLYQQNVWASDCSYINKDVTEKVYYYFTLLKLRQEEIFHLQHGSAQPHVYPKDIERLEVTKPAEPLICEFEEKVGRLYYLCKILTKKNKPLKQTRDLLLPRLMSGKLSVEHLLTPDI